MASRPAISSIAMALAGKTASVDIPELHDSHCPAGRDDLSNLHDQPDSRRGHHHSQTNPQEQPGPLPTPPSSLSPSLHPRSFKTRAANVPDSPTSVPVPVDSDLDLHDNPPLQEHRLSPEGQRQPRHLPLVAETLGSVAGPESAAAAAISPAMLAKYHLPDILLGQGPLAIRHIMGYLTTSVPGFSGIPPAKARRVVVAALEGKGNNGGAAGGINGDVRFEKVGWGRWNAKRRGKVAPPNGDSFLAGKHNTITPPSSVPSSYPRHLTSGAAHESGQYAISATAESVAFSRSDFGPGDHGDNSMLEHEADKMSLDGDEHAYCSSLEASDNDALMDGDWDEADITDEEDWAQIGAAALRARSFPNASNHKPDDDIDDQSNWRGHQRSGGGPSTSTLAKAVPGQVPLPRRKFPSLSHGMQGNVEERAAVEALLQLGSM